MQGRSHGVRKSGSNELTTAVTALATSLAAAIQPRGESSKSPHENATGLSTPPQLKSKSPVYTLGLLS